MQFVQNIVNESCRDIIVCSTICAIGIVMQYLMTHFVLSPDGLSMESLALHGTAGSKLLYILKNNPVFSFKVRNGIYPERIILWDGLHDFLLLVTKLYQLRIYNMSEYEEDLAKEQKRMNMIRKKNPYMRDYFRKLKYPE